MSRKKITDPTFEEAREIVLKKKKSEGMTKKTLQNYKSFMLNIDVLGRNKKISEYTSEDAQAILNKLENDGELAKQTIHNIRKRAISWFNACIKLQICDPNHNPFKSTIPISFPTLTRKAWTMDEVDRLKESALQLGTDHVLFLEWVLTGGLRFPSEYRALDCSLIDLEKKTMIVTRCKTSRQTKSEIFPELAVLLTGRDIADYKPFSRSIKIISTTIKEICALAVIDDETRWIAYLGRHTLATRLNYTWQRNRICKHMGWLDWGVSKNYIDVSMKNGWCDQEFEIPSRRFTEEQLDQFSVLTRGIINEALEQVNDMVITESRIDIILQKNGDKALTSAEFMRLWHEEYMSRHLE